MCCLKNCDGKYAPACFERASDIVKLCGELCDMLCNIFPDLVERGIVCEISGIFFRIPPEEPAIDPDMIPYIEANCTGLVY